MEDCLKMGICLIKGREMVRTGEVKSMFNGIYGCEWSKGNPDD